MKPRNPPFHALLLLVGGLLVAAAPLAGAEDAAPVQQSYAIGALTGGLFEEHAPILGVGLRGQAWLPAALGIEPESEGESEPLRAFTGDDVVELLLGLVPGLGDEEGEAVELAEDHILVTASDARQAEVAAALEALWVEAARRVDLEMRRVRLDASAAARLDPAVLAELRAGRLAAGFHDALRAAGARVEVAAARVRPGYRAVLAHTDRTRYLRDYEVEIAQDSVVGDPQVDTLTTGWAVEARPFALQDGSVLLEVYVQTAAADLPLRTCPLEVEPFGSIEMPDARVWRATARGRLVPGETRALLVSATSTGGIDAFLATANLVDPRAAPTRALRLDVGALVTAREDRALMRHPDDPGFWTREPWPVEEVMPAVDGDRLVEFLMAQTGRDLWETEGVWIGVQGGRRLVVVADAGTRQRVAALVGEAEAAWLASLRLGLDLVEVGPDGTRRTVASAALDAPAGGRVVWQAGREAAFLADWSVEVAQEARTGDPRVDTLFAGLALEARATPAPSGDRALLQLDVHSSEADATFETVRPGNACTGPIEIPRVAAVGALQDLVVETGRPATVSLGRLEDGRTLELVVRLDR